MNVVGLFAGIGGIELGLARSEHKAVLLCENNDAACAVLEDRFRDVPLVRDVRDLHALPTGTELVAAGFPCQDLSQAGTTRGISGKRSGLVSHVFRLLSKSDVPWVFLENVPFMLQLARGHAMRFLVDQLEDLGYTWAYRVVDSRAFGLPQRRERVLLLASRVADPARSLFHEDEGEPEDVSFRGHACGFYWTEGLRGLGWAVDGVPTLKGGSGLGIPSPPAIWMPDGRIVTPEIRDAERLQGFGVDWTLPAEDVARAGVRWTLVGNAVTVDVAAWVGRILRSRMQHEIDDALAPLPPSGSWPTAACGGPDGRYAVRATKWPARIAKPSLMEFLRYPVKQLSARGTRGFLERLERGSLRYPVEFHDALRFHLRRMERAAEHQGVSDAPRRARYHGKL